jgi:hypothetical protein
VLEIVHVNPPYEVRSSRPSNVARVCSFLIVVSGVAPSPGARLVPPLGVSRCPETNRRARKAACAPATINAAFAGQFDRGVNATFVEAVSVDASIEFKYLRRARLLRRTNIGTRRFAALSRARAFQVTANRLKHDAYDFRRSQLDVCCSNAATVTTADELRPRSGG